VALVLGVLVSAAMVAGYFAVQRAERNAKSDMREFIIGLAPTFAQELKALGHGGLPSDCAPDDPLYLRMIESQKSWLSLNPAISDVYSWRLLPGNRLTFMVDSETDYDGDGKFGSERERGTPVGEIYENTATAIQLAAFEGNVVLDETVQVDKWGRWISAFAPLRDEHGRVEACVGLDFSARNWEARIWDARLAVNASMTAIVLFFQALGLLFGWWKLTAKSDAERTALSAQYKEDLGKTVAARTRDLARQNSEFEAEILERARVQDALTDAQEKLIAASRQAGMAEVAASVLHNVGNVLNSANVSVQMIVQTLASSRVSRFVDAGKLLEKNSTNLAEFSATPQGKALPDYIGKLAMHAVEEHQHVLGEAKRVSEHLEHIRTIVSRQQGIARSGGRRELVELSMLVEQALSLGENALGSARVQIVREFSTVSAAMLDKHLALQVLVNLIRNAYHAVLASDQSDKTITLRIEGRPSRMVRVSVEDNGIGISGENMTKLFSFGFTTKSDGNGFGLHHSASTAHQMGGSLSVVSMGEGKGAAFLLDLPLDRCAQNETSEVAMPDTRSMAKSAA
jgi:signal transduction histidine kinase